MAKLNKRLLPSKTFYFFFFSALGSIFPYISLFFKQLQLSAQKTGILTGTRPFVQCIANPAWGLVVDKFNMPKISLLVGIVGWLFTYISIGVIPSYATISRCRIDSASGMANNSADGKEFHESKQLSNVSLRSRRPWFESNGKHNISRYELIDGNLSKQFSPKISREILDSSHHGSNGTVPAAKSDINPARIDLFLVMLLIIVFGNLVSAPVQTIANIATLQALSEETYKYGKQRLFGSIGWGLTAFTVGIAVGLQGRSRSRECGENSAVDYKPCFYVFGAMMVFAFVSATFMRLTKESPSQSAKYILINIRKQIDITIAYLLVTSAYCGFALGLVETFLFWHLHDLGGSQLLFSIITGVNSLAEMLGYFFSEHFIERFGHLNVVIVGLLSSSVQMLCYGLAKNPWVVLPVEVLKSLVVSCTWTALVSYIGIRRGSVATLQTMLHGLYWGLGYGSGGVIGGIFVHKYGAANVFLVMMLLGFLQAFFLVLVKLKKGVSSKHGDYENVEESSAETEADNE